MNSIGQSIGVVKNVERRKMRLHRIFGNKTPVVGSRSASTPGLVWRPGGVSMPTSLAIRGDTRGRMAIATP